MRPTNWQTHEARRIATDKAAAERDSHAQHWRKVRLENMRRTENAKR